MPLLMIPIMSEPMNVPNGFARPMLRTVIPRSADAKPSIMKPAAPSGFADPRRAVSRMPVKAAASPESVSARIL